MCGCESKSGIGDCRSLETAFPTVGKARPGNRGSKNTLAGSTRSESAVEGSNIRPRRSTAAAPSTLPLRACGCVTHAALNTQHRSGLRVWRRTATLTHDDRWTETPGHAALPSDRSDHQDLILRRLSLRFSLHRRVITLKGHHMFAFLCICCCFEAYSLFFSFFLHPERLQIQLTADSAPRSR